MTVLRTWSGASDTRSHETPRLTSPARDITDIVVCPSEGGVATARPARPMSTSLAALLTRHILRDGELVLLILKPSLWFIVLGAMRFAAVVLIGIIAAKLWIPHAGARAAEVGAFLITARVMWAVLQWMGRLYVLTDLRVLRLSGVFNVDIFDCPLRKVSHARMYRTFRERLLRLGSIEIVPAMDGCTPGDWRTIKRPVEVLDTIEATVRRAKQGGGGIGGPGCTSE
jgi:hypothetical protein